MRWKSCVLIIDSFKHRIRMKKSFRFTDMIMQVIFLFIGLFISVNGNCVFRSNGSKYWEEKLREKGIYNRTFTITSNTSTYSIGICILPSNARDNAAVIQQEKNETYILGQLNQANLLGGDDWMLLTYEDGTAYNNICENKKRSVSLMFSCGKNTNEDRVLQEQANGDNNCNYMFEFQGYGMCPRLTPSKKNLSGGAIFLIIFLCLASIYLIGGFFYMRIQRGARGLDQIPNLEFWRRLGHLAADGCDYCCRCNRNAPRPGYYIDETGPDMRGDDDILAP